MMNSKCFEFNMLPVNTYVLWDQTKEAVIIDPGCIRPEEKEELQQFILREELKVKHLLCTHLHFDHIFGVPFVEDTFQVTCEAHRGDEPWLEQVEQRAALFGIPYHEKGRSIGHELNDGDIISFGKTELKCLYTPGHSKGSLVFYCESDHCLFAGDVLFRGSIGRTDLMGGNQEELIESIRTKLLNLPDKTVVYPGHGPQTTIGFEKRVNPYI